MEVGRRLGSWEAESSEEGRTEGRRKRVRGGKKEARQIRKGGNTEEEE